MYAFFAETIRATTAQNGPFVHGFVSSRSAFWQTRPADKAKIYNVRFAVRRFNARAEKLMAWNLRGSRGSRHSHYAGGDKAQCVASCIYIHSCPNPPVFDNSTSVFLENWDIARKLSGITIQNQKLRKSLKNWAISRSIHQGDWDIGVSLLDLGILGHSPIIQRHSGLTQRSWDIGTSQKPCETGISLNYYWTISRFPKETKIWCEKLSLCTCKYLDSWSCLSRCPIRRTGIWVATKMLWGNDDLIDAKLTFVVPNFVHTRKDENIQWRS